MSVIRVNKNKNYIVMSNHHFKEKELSLKAKGLLSEMLSLPENWDYSISGLVSINKENASSIKSALEELKDFGYLKVTKLMPNETKTGRIEYIYDIYEQKQEGKKQEVENLGVEFLEVENQRQYNINNKINNNKIYNNIYNKEKFKNPSLEEIKKYCKERGNDIDANKFYEYYEASNWKDKEGKQVKNWKQKIITWEGRCKKSDNTLPNWFDKNYEKDISNLDELNKILEGF